MARAKVTKQKSKKKPLRRPIPHMTRFNKAERKMFDLLVDESELTGQDYALCRLLYIPLSVMGGKEPKSAQWVSEQAQKQKDQKG